MPGGAYRKEVEINAAGKETSAQAGTLNDAGGVGAVKELVVGAEARPELGATEELPRKLGKLKKQGWRQEC